MKSAEFNPAFEACGQSFYDSRPQNGFSVRDGICQGNRNSKNRAERKPHNPAPTGPPLLLFRPWFVMTWHAEVLERQSPQRDARMTSGSVVVDKQEHSLTGPVCALDTVRGMARAEKFGDSSASSRFAWLIFLTSLAERMHERCAFSQETQPV